MCQIGRIGKKSENVIPLEIGIVGKDDLRVPPQNRLEKLKGDRKDQWSIRINDQWRICFKFDGGEAANVEIVDDH